MISFVERRESHTLLIMILFFALCVASCSSVYSGKADIGSSLEYIRGKPDFTLNSVSNISDEGITEVDLNLSIQKNSLIFKSQQDSLVSRIQIGVDIISENDSSVLDKSYQLLIGKSREQKYYDQEFIYKRLTFEVAEGEYTIYLKIIDLHTGKSEMVTQQLTVPDPSSKVTFLNEIQLSRKVSTGDSYIPINGYIINQGFDSLKTSFQLIVGKKEFPAEVTLKLLKFAADHEPARPLSGREHRNYSLEKKGLDYAKTETIQSTKRTLNSSGNVTIENSYVNLPVGNYRLEVTVRNDSKVLFEVRDFGIRSENYPQVKNARELAAPLYYLMDENEYEEMMSISAQDSLKKVVDSFWLNNIQNPSKAKEIIRMYYDRVESANQRFGNFKEGWKTDPGMIFILFGSPLYYDSGFGEMTWYYEFDTSIDKRGFYFKDSRFGNNKFPFQNYHLERAKDYFGLEFKQIQSWRDGSILYLSQR